MAVCVGIASKHELSVTRCWIMSPDRIEQNDRDRQRDKRDTDGGCAVRTAEWKAAWSSEARESARHAVSLTVSSQRACIVYIT